MALIAKVCRSCNVTVLLVSHDVNPLLPVVGRVIYMANGQSASDMLSKLYSSPVEVVYALDRVFVVGAEL